MSSGAVPRVGIPASSRKTIQDIKEIAGKHSDEDIYAMLKECNMDPNETTQKLLYLDTFHEVKRKRAKKKLIVNNQTAERNRWASGMQQRRGARGGRGNNSSGYSSNDSGGGQRIGPPKENGCIIQTPISPAGLTVESAPHSSVAEVNKPQTRPPLSNVAVKLLQDLNPTPTPIPIPTTTPTPTSTFNIESEGTNSESSGVYSSASDPVLLPSLNPRNPNAVGTIKRESATPKIVPDLTNNASLPENINEDGGKADQVDPITMESNSKTLPGVEKDQSFEPLKPASMLSPDNATVTVPQDGWSGKQANGPSNVMTYVGPTVLPRANISSIPKTDDSVLSQATSLLNKKLEDLNITSQKPVIFPDHVQVPEAFRNGLTFGTLDGSFGQETKVVERTTLSNEGGGTEPSLSHETCEGEYFSPMLSNVPPTAPPLPESSKPDIMPTVVGSPYSFLPNGPDYGFSMMPPMLAPHHLVHVEETEVNNSSVSSTSVSSQTSQQTTATVSPPIFPYLRQPYPSNYFPYNPYFPHLYMHPNGPQFYGHSNIYMPPPQVAAGTGVKFPVPQIYKPGTVATNLTHFGIPSGYGSYGLGYGIASTMAPGSSSSTEDLTAPELKEKDVYPVLKQNEESHVWTSASARDIQSLQANFFYNFPHGQQVTYTPAPPGQQGSLAGMYHLTTPTTAAPPPTAPPPPPPQSPPQQVMIGSMETPAGGAYSSGGWNPKLLNRENI